MNINSNMMLLRVAYGLVVVLCALLPVKADPGKKVFCYYSSFAQNRHGAGKFLPEDIDPYLCTHIIFAFVDIDAQGTDLMAFNRNDVGPSGLYARTMALKKQNPALKILLAVGGWQIGSKPFIPMISDYDNMRQWVKNVISYLRKYEFDGFDMDWEFPATRGSPPEDKYRYTKLMKGLYEAFAEEARTTGREKLILTMATAAGTFFINTSYEPNKIVKYMDYMLLMTYNYHGQWEKRTGHQSPLWKHRHDPPGEQSELFQNWSIDYWLNMGVPKDKLIVGLATYGMTFTLIDPHQHGVHAPVNGGGRMGKYTKETGILSYYEICENIQENGWKTGWIDDQAVPYAYGEDQWVGFDNIDSMKMKAENIMTRGLAGAFVWSVEMDDFGGMCGTGRYPLLSTVTRVLKPYEGLQVAPAETQPKMTTSAPATTTGKRVTNWGKPTWRSWNTKNTKAPWWRLQTATASLSTNWNARPTGRPSPSQVTQTIKSRSQAPRTVTSRSQVTQTIKSRSQAPRTVTSRSQVTQTIKSRSQVPQTTPSRPRNPWENTVHDKSHGGISGTQERPWKQGSSAGAQDGGAINCRRLGSGLFAHPSNCEKFIMCLPGAWMDYPPHIMDCPAGTRFDDNMKICNHANSVDCLD